jgi:hypothetical protein
MGRRVSLSIVLSPLVQRLRRRHQAKGGVFAFAPTETLPTEEQLLFEERQEQLIQEAKAKFLADFKVDRNNKVVRQRATELASL